ncbi:2-isopropylmalate synthase [Candidatus Margulisiibacteriota bacterium]
MANKYKLKNPWRPELFRKYFSYNRVPRITISNKIVPVNLPKKIWITDTTFRDGQQSRPPYTVKQIVDVFDMMHELGGPKGIIRQTEFFLYSKKDKEAIYKCMEKHYKYPEITGWIRAVKSDFQLVKEMGLKETGILTSCSDYHIYLKLKKDRKQIFDQYVGIVEAALEAGVIPRCHLEDITRADMYGFVLPFVQKLMKMSKEAKMPIKIRACDTLGYGVPHVAAELPRSVPKIVHLLLKEGEIPPEQLEWHGHNDFHYVHSDGVAAWLYGCPVVNAALLGFGERTGNPPLESMLMSYISLTGRTDGINTRVITKIADYFRRELGFHIPTNYPFVGSEFNVTRAGIHADGIIKNEEIYNIFNTEKILDRPIGVAITDKSGMAGIALWLNGKLKLKGRHRIGKDHPAVNSIFYWINEQYLNRRTTSISNEEILKLVKIYLPQHYKTIKENTIQ